MIYCKRTDHKIQNPQVELAKSHTAVAVNDSIDKNIEANDRRLDIKMNRQTAYAKNGDVLTIQKYFDKGDSTKIVKLRYEYLTGKTKMEVVQYHYIDQSISMIHEYQYDKTCKPDHQCMYESKIYLDHDTIFFGLERNATGTPPIIENARYQTRPLNQRDLESFLIKQQNILHQYDSLQMRNDKL